MSEFVAALRTQVDQARQALEQALAQAREAGDRDEVHGHSARLLDLLEGAASHGVVTTDWVSPELVSLASIAAGDGS